LGRICEICGRMTEHYEDDNKEYDILDVCEECTQEYKQQI
jgi:ribosome-binding protein aMBF1 (putative translation factor)